MRLHPLTARRGRAYLRDCVGYLGIAAAMVPLGAVASWAGWGAYRGYVLAVSAVPPLVAAVVAARRESGAGRATPGKRRQGLVVAPVGGTGAIGFGPALLRNVVKIAVPWQIGHTVAVGAAFGGFEAGDPLTLAAAGLSYVVIGVLVVGVAAGAGRAPHDRVAGSVVVDVR